MQPVVLVVDDEPTIAEVICEVLSDEGYRVAIAPTAGEAQALVGERAFNLVLQDMRLPDMLGGELVAWMRGNPRTATVPIVVMSASSDLAESAIGVGATATLVKPFDLDVLLECVATYCPLEAAAGA